MNIIFVSLLSIIPRLNLQGNADSTYLIEKKMSTDCKYLHVRWYQ